MDVRFFLLAGSFGRTFAHEVNSTKGSQFILSGLRNSVVKPLLTVADVPVINQWILAIRNCPRLQPLEKKLYIVVNDDHYEYYRQWAEDPNQSLGGFPVSNIINNGSKHSDSTRPGDLADLALGVRETGADGWVFAASADYCFEPMANLQHFIEHAIISGRDTVAFCPPCSASLQSGAALECQGSGAHALVTRASLPASPASTASSIPFVGLHGSTLPTLESLAAESRGPWRSLERFVVHLSGLHTLSGVFFPTVFSVRTLRDLLFVDMFFAHWNNRSIENIRAGKVRSKHDVPPETIFGSDEPTTHVLDGVVQADLDMMVELNDFKFDFAEALINRSKFAGADITLPKRFTQSHAWNYDKRRPQHPCYTTSSAAYGAKNPKPADMPMTWNGIHGEFTTTFKGMTRYKGLRCFTDVSKVHKAFDEYTHYR